MPVHPPAWGSGASPERRGSTRASPVTWIICPRALVISNHAGIAAGLAAGARRGVLMKAETVLERLRKVPTVAFDKTGTLTADRPEVTDVVGLTMPETKVLSLAAALEAGSSHPLGAAIVSRAGAEAVPIPPATAAAAMPGEGVTGRVGGLDVALVSPPAVAKRAAGDAALAARIATLGDAGKTVSVLLAGSEAAGLVAMRDEPRPDAAAGLRALAGDGIATVMLTGDDPRVAAALGQTLGIPVRAGLLPADKRRSSA